MQPASDAVPPARRRRRAVGPPGARPAQDVGRWAGDVDEAPTSPQDDERLLADVPPHHGT